MAFTINSHNLRHTCATILLRKGVHPKIVSELLGHASVAITMDVYSHYIGTMQAAAVEAMQAIQQAEAEPVATTVATKLA